MHYAIPGELGPARKPELPTIAEAIRAARQPQTVGDLKAALLAMATVVAEFADAETMDSVQDCIDAAADLCDRLPIFDGYQAAVERAEDNNWCARREARRLGL